MSRVRIEFSQGLYGTKVIDVASGKELRGVKFVQVTHDAGQPAVATLQVQFPEVSCVAMAEIIKVCPRCEARRTDSPRHSLSELLSRPICELKAERWTRGVKTYRKSPTDPFVGDPLAEAIPELLDFLSYVDELLRTEYDARRMGGVLEARDSARYALDLIRELYRG